jgi:SulP family sulfate permease
VADVATIPSSLPLPALPDLGLAPALAVDALAIAIIAMVQGAGISKGYPNPDGRYADPSRDFIGVGVGNLGSGLIGGIAIGGSVGSTALNVSSGARSRLANVVAGVIAISAVLFLAGLIGRLAIPAMAGLLIMAGLGSIHRGRIEDVLLVGSGPRVVFLVTLVATLALPLVTAVFVGVALSAAIAMIASSRDVRIVELVAGEAGRWREGPSPARLADETVTVLQVYGSLSFAAAERVTELLPDPEGSKRPVVVLRLRQHLRLETTLQTLLVDYRRRVAAVGGRLILAGVGPEAHDQLLRTGLVPEVFGALDVFDAGPELRASTEDAIAEGRRWLEATSPAQA